MTAPNIPTFLNPASTGQLSNKRGSNTGADAITFQTRFANPLSGAGDQIGDIRATVSRTARFGTQLQTPETVWDSGWTGTPSVQAIPTAASEAAPVVTVYGDRVYCLFLGTNAAGGSGRCWSAPLQGGGVGAWRPEAGLGASNQWFPFTNALYAAGATQLAATQGWLYACVSVVTTTVQAVILGAPIGPGGVLGSWVKLSDAPYSLNHGAQFCGGFTGLANVAANPPGILVLCGGVNTAGTGATNTATTWIFVDGSIFGWGVGPTLPGNRANGSAYWDGNFPVVYIFGGDDLTNAAITPIAANLTAGIGLAAWANLTNMPAARTGCSVAVTLGPADGLTHIWVFGGAATIGGAATTTIFHSTLIAPSSLGTWTTSGLALPATGGGMAAFSGSTPGRAAAAPLYDPGDSGGASGTGTLATPYVAYTFTASTTVRAANVHAGSPAFVSGNAPALTTTNLGTGSAITNNADGTQDITFLYGAFGGAALTGLDGDSFQLSVQYISRAGDASALGTTVLKIGQAPTIGSVSPANAATPSNGQPPISFVYTPGAGGAAQQWWQVVLKQGVGGTIIFDTGQRYDTADSVSPLTVAPLLIPSQQYQLIITVNSLDNPVSGSTDQATSTTTFTTTAFARPAAPGSFTATPSGPNGNVALSWGSVAGSTYRVYYRRTGSSTFLLLADAVAATSYTAMDHIALGVSYDFAVSAVNATPAESVLSSTAAATIPLVQGISPGYGAYLHVAGLGSTFGMPLRVRGAPAVSETVDMAYLTGFGQGAPIARYGDTDFRTLQVAVNLIDQTPATLKTLQAILDQVKAGQVCFYRDALGAQLVVALDASQAIAVLLPRNRQAALKLTEVPDLIGPYVAAGSAQGYLTLTNGRKPPLDTSERLL